MQDLTGFQRDILKAVATIDGQPHGLAIKHHFENETDYSQIHHGRLYPNLDALVDKGLLEKGTKDERTNEYTLSRRGRREIAVYANEWNEALNETEAELEA